VFQWFPLHNLITAEPILQGVYLISNVYFASWDKKQFWSYFVSSCTHLFEV